MIQALALLLFYVPYPFERSADSLPPHTFRDHHGHTFLAAPDGKPKE